LLACGSWTAGAVLWAAIYFAGSLPSLPKDSAGELLTRGRLLGDFLLVPDLVVQQWFGDPPQAALFDRLIPMTAATAIVLVAAMIGWLVIGLWPTRDSLSRAERLVLSAGAGLCLVSHLVLFLGLAGVLKRPVVLVASLATVAACIVARYRRRRSSGQPAADRAETLNFPLHRGLWLALPFALAIVLGAVLPPIEFDVREYHLQAPKEFFQAGRISFLPHNVYGNMPLGAEMHSLLAMVACDDFFLGALAGKLITAFHTLLAGACLYVAGCRFSTPLAGSAGAVIYLSTPWVVQVSNLGLIDGTLGCYLLLACYAAAVNFTSTSPGSPWLSGLLAGGAAACKYTGLVFVVVPLSAAVGLASRRAWFGSTCVFLIAAAAGTAGWYVKNAVLTSNPVYPLAGSLFATAGRIPEQIEQWKNAHRPPGYSPADFLRRAADFLGGSEWQSPLLVPLAALAMIHGPRRRLWRLLLGYIGLYFVFWWLFTHRIDRFWVPILPVAAWLAGVGAEEAVARSKAFRVDSAGSGAVMPRVVGRVAGIVLTSIAGLLIVYCLFVATGGPGGYNRFFVSLDRLRTSGERVDPVHLYLNRHAQGGARVLLVGDAQPFDLEIPAVYNTTFDECLFERLVRGKPAEEVRRVLSDEGITHVYVHWSEIARYRRPGNYGFTDFVQPNVLESLVKGGVLSPVAPGEDWRGELFEVSR
jgi:hypothetical protein